MNEAELRAEVQRWLRYAHEDLTAAEETIARPEIVPRHACWLAQQATEKALKAVLIFLQIDFPRSHDLDALRNLVPDGWQLKEDHPDLADLTEWAVEARYPGDWPEATEAESLSAVREARDVWTSVRRDLIDRGFDVDDAVAPQVQVDDEDD